MRLATWNSCLKFASNLPHLLALEADVAVVCEAQPLLEWPSAADGRTLSALTQPVGQGGIKHLAVIASEPWTIVPHPDASGAPPWTLPVVIDGPAAFTLLALWPVRAPGWPSDYVEQIDQAVDWVEKVSADTAVVVAGDFNAPIGRTRTRYRRVVDRLAALGLVDAYTAIRGSSPGAAAPEGTYYHLRRRSEPFHIDHVVIPASWTSGGRVMVGEFDTWVAAGRSDHVPVVVDLRDEFVQHRS